MCFNLSKRSELTTLVKSTITTFRGPWPREGVTPDLIWASFMRTFFFFLTLARWLNYQRLFLWGKSAGKSWVVYLSHCVENQAFNFRFSGLKRTDVQKCVLASVTNSNYCPFWNNLSKNNVNSLAGLSLVVPSLSATYNWFSPPSLTNTNSICKQVKKPSIFCLGNLRAAVCDRKMKQAASSSIFFKVIFLL